MKFSILVPVYNVESYLEQCVESLLCQTFDGEYEIILVDDGSTDSSGRICDKYAQAHPEKIRVIHKKNGGHTSARLEAIKAAAGEYVLFCDSDDFVEASLLEDVADVLFNNPQTDMVIYSFSYFQNGQKVSRKKTVSENTVLFENESRKKLYEILITTPLINALWTKAVKSEIIKKHASDYTDILDKALAEDAYIVSDLITECKKIISINNPLCNYRTNDESISRSYRPETIAKKNTLYVYDRFLKHLPEWGMDTEEYRQRLNARWLSEVMYTFSQYYENVSSKEERKQVLGYDWRSMLPEECLKTSSPFDNPENRRLFEMIINKKYFGIKIFFLRKKLRKLYKSAKARIKAI